MKKFKDLINEVTIHWFAPMVKDKFNEFAKSPQFEMFNSQLLNVSKTEYSAELNNILSQINSLENYADIIGYVRMNKINLSDSLDASKLQETVLQGGLKSLPKILIKIQLGYISEVSDKFFEEVRMWQDKIGRDTDLSEIPFEDLKYLIHVSLDKQVSNLKDAFGDDQETLGEVREELNELADRSSNLTQKRNDFTIIKIYFNKLRGQLFANLDGSMLDSSEHLPADLATKVSHLEKANELISQIEFVLDFASQLEKELKVK